MGDSMICSLQDMIITDGKEFLIEDIELHIEPGTMVALVSEDASARHLLQVLGGLRYAKQGNIYLYGEPIHDVSELVNVVQYVPDDIICYRDMTVEDYLCGVVMATTKEMIPEAARLCQVFGINISEQLLDLTFEQNRLVGMIQAIVRKPKLLLIDKPYSMIRKKTGQLLRKELIQLQKTGTAIIMTASAYADLNVICSQYLFLRDNEARVVKGNELPKLTKVVTIVGGELATKDETKCEVLFQQKSRMRFLCWETDAEELLYLLYRTDCDNFTVEELTMEETLFHEYERWMS